MKRVIDEVFTTGVVWWLYSLDLGDMVPKGSWEPPVWLKACWKAANARGDVVGNDEAKKQPKVRPRWRGFLLLLSKDHASRDAIDSFVRLSEQGEVAVDGNTLDFVGNMFHEFVKKMEQEAPVVQEIKHRQLVRARRIELREVGFTGKPMKRASDKDFLKEALPPKIVRKP